MNEGKNRLNEIRDNSDSLTDGLGSGKVCSRRKGIGEGQEAQEAGKRG